jgi:hypothetical protein
MSRAMLEKLKPRAKRIAKKIMDLPWPVWPILFISLLVFQNRMVGILRNLPPLQWFLLLLTVLIGIIGLLRILVK